MPRILKIAYSLMYPSVPSYLLNKSHTDLSLWTVHLSSWNEDYQCFWQEASIYTIHPSILCTVYPTQGLRKAEAYSRDSGQPLAKPLGCQPLTGHNQAHTHSFTTNNSDMSLNLQCMSFNGKETSLLHTQHVKGGGGNQTLNQKGVKQTYWQEHIKANS